MAQSFHARPSDVLGIVDRVSAFCLDRAIFTFASAIEHDQEVATGRLPKSAKEATHNHVRQRILDAYLGIDTQKAKGRFAAPK